MSVVQRYIKLGHVQAAIDDGDFTKAALLEGVAAGTYKVVNIKGRSLTASEVERHLAGTLDGETVVRL